MKKPTVKTFLSGLIIICSLGLIGYGLISSPPGHDWLMKHYLKSDQTLTRQKIEHNQHQKANFDPQAVHAIKAEDLLRSWNNSVQPIGYMTIPAVKMKNRIFKGYGLRGDNLLYGVATMKPKQIMGSGNYALAGHYMHNQTIFHNLHRVKVGNKVYLTDLKLIYKYRVTKVLTSVSNRRMDLIDDQLLAPQITLVTCENLTTSNLRTVVQGDLLGTYTVTAAKLRKLGI